jgi:hypothetical protein
MFKKKQALYLPLKSRYEQKNVSRDTTAIFCQGNFGVKRVFLLADLAAEFKVFACRARRNTFPPGAPRLIHVVKFYTNFYLFSQALKAVLAAMVGFKKYLRVKGVGYKILTTPEKNITVTAGATHLIFGKLHLENKYKLTRKARMLRVRGLNLCSLTTCLAKIRNQRKIDPYKLKGIRLRYQKLRRKAVKKKR